MEQFFVVIAIIIFWIFKQASAGSRRRMPGDDSFESGPLTKGGLDATLEEANRRAVEALQRWEAKQRGGVPEQEPVTAPRTSPTRREPLPEAPRERSPRLRLAGRAAERERKKAYAEIASMLDPARDAPSSSRRSDAVGRGAVARGKARRFGLKAAPGPAPAAPEVAATPPTPAPEEPAPYRLDSSGRRPKRRNGPESAFARLERLPLAARAIVYSEILGRAKAYD